MDNHMIDDAFSFQIWETPFENSPVELRGVEYTMDQRLIFMVHVSNTDSIYRVTFESLNAFRVLDEHGLLEIWEKTSELGGRPGRTTFRIRNHLWTKESPISFLASNGWSYMVATDFDCIEIVAEVAPMIVLEGSDSQSIA